MGKKIKKSKTVSSSVCRVHKSKNFTLLSNSFLRSSNLSLASVGLLGRVMGLPEEWDYSIKGLSSICKEGETAIETVLKDLQEWGYLKISKLYPNETEDGRIHYVYDFYESSEKDKTLSCTVMAEGNMPSNKSKRCRVNKTDNFTIVSSLLLRSKAISLKSLGLLLRVLSFPDDWDYSVAGLVFICKEGKTAIDSALKELKNIGYLVVTKLYANMTASKSYAVQYSVIEYAYKIIYAGKYEPVSILKDIVKNYRERYYENDRNYRLFYFYYDKLTETSAFEKLRELIENIYTNDYLQNICTNWTKAFVEEAGSSGLPLQINFWRDRVEPIKERVVVFISDAMRYEVGVSLYEKLNADEKCKASLYAMQTVLPSITMCGMAALLPHKTYELTPDYRLLVDGKPCASTNERAKIISSYKPNSLCIQFDEIKTKKWVELKDMVMGLDVIYIYHNQIDARGDKAPTEDEVFNACDEAVEEIASMIRKLTSANVTHFLITSDHGFVYKRDELQVGNKIGDVSSKSQFMGKRYAVTDTVIEMDGISGVSLGDVYGNGDTRSVSFPISADIFKAQGGGLNFVHGGCSPQEMIIPLIDVKTEKSKVETTFAEISMTTNISKITNLSVNLEFFQRQPVSDVVKPATYHIYFEAEDGERVSNENQYHADSTESNPLNTKAKLRFSFKNRIYSNKDKYYLIIMDEEHNIQLAKIPFTIDIAMANDFGF